jgi:hypothetical protein
MNMDVLIDLSEKLVPIVKRVGAGVWGCLFGVFRSTLTPWGIGG